VLSGSADSTTETGQLPGSLLAAPDGEWLAMTSAGFFDASDGGLAMLSVVQGLKVFSIDQFRDQLQRRDLLQILSGSLPTTPRVGHSHCPQRSTAFYCSRFFHP